MGRVPGACLYYHADLADTGSVCILLDNPWGSVAHKHLSRVCSVSCSALESLSHGLSLHMQGCGALVPITAEAQGA